MIKIVKNNLLSVFIAAAFFLSHVVNTHANHFKSDHQRENIAVAVMEQGKKKAVNIASLFYAPNAFHETKNEVAFEGKIEKVFEPITLGFLTTTGALGVGFVTGLLMSVLTGIIGWAVGITKAK
ncbi:hypothetical protein [Bartonella sp. MM73XJBT]|uniref:hypothetical protein n=1 Tax=Bartonella sp. MM73XJBT TaxID=3019095 RepID=UPI0023619F52|nr:hypothetical protein [Bartonella sp. MM73XJBT]